MNSNAVAVIRYQSFDQDFVESGNQTLALPDDYDWKASVTPSNALRRLRDCAATLLARLYWHAHLRVRIHNKQAFESVRGRGFFLYGNHTQPVGDALLPRVVAHPARASVVCSPANLGIPVLGKALPALGALPIPAQRDAMKRFLSAVDERIEQGGCVAVYPEAHVWPWCTFIRDFPATSFGFPVRTNAPSFCMTVTYQRRRFSRTPRAEVYIDGPFFPDESLPKGKRKEALRRKVAACMRMHANSGTCMRVRYEREGGAQ